ncbi:rod shape-determining protein MreB [Hutsoniella sourekii]
MSIFKKEGLGIDLGTVNTIIYLRDKGIFLKEPTLLAIDRESQEILAFGREAEALIGRSNMDQIEFVRPIKDGVIHNFTLTKELLAHFLSNFIKKSFRKPEVVICIPSTISKVERQAVVEVIRDLGVQKASIVEEPFAAAIGSELAINQAKGRMIVDIGGGTTDIATISYNDIVDKLTIRAAGNRMDEAIQTYIRNQYQLVISIETARKLKEEIGNARYSEVDKDDQLLIDGLTIIDRKPKHQLIRAEIVALALDEVIQEIVTAIKQVLQVTPPEMMVDLMDGGVFLSGGASLLKRLPERLSDEIGLTFDLVSAPIDAVAIGAGRLVDHLETIKD